MYTKTIFTFVSCVMFLASSGRGLAQPFHFGVVAGGSITSGFPNESFTTLAGNQTLYTTHSSGAGNYVVGIMAEVGLPLHFSVEADGLYRPLNFKTITSSVPSTSADAPSNTVLMWEVPVLLKYRFSKSILPGIKPVVGVGPAFRISANRNDTDLSNHGITSEGGVEARLARLRLSPVMRYTRWAADKVPAYQYIPRSKPNQVEGLIGLSF
jgi:hypothetical protein